MSMGDPVLVRKSSAKVLPDARLSRSGGWSRRQVLGTLAATAGLPILGHAATPARKVGIIGGGMAGVSLAWMLDGGFDVMLFEARDSIGGNVRNIQVEVAGHPYIVDMGAQFFHPGPYPTYVKLLELLGLYPPESGGSHAFPASITVAEPTEPTPRFVSPALPGRVWPILAPWNTAGIQAFATTFAAAKIREQLNAPWSVSLGDWLPTLGLTQAQIDLMILPWAASLFSGDIEQARTLSARAAMIFAAKSLPENPTDPVLYYVMDNNGMIEALTRMAASFTTVQIHTNTPITGVTRALQGGFRIYTGNGLSVHVDDVVFAASGPSTLALLGGISNTALERAALQGIGFHNARLMLHTDPVYVPPNPNFWSFLNCQVQSGFCEASMWLAQVLTPAPGASPPNLWKSWVTHRQSLPSQVLHEEHFQHMLPTPSTLSSQFVLRARQGQGGVWFAGGYTLPYDSQETALRSALGVALGLNASAARARALLPIGG